MSNPFWSIVRRSFDGSAAHVSCLRMTLSHRLHGCQLQSKSRSPCQSAWGPQTGPTGACSAQISRSPWRQGPAACACPARPRAPLGTRCLVLCCRTSPHVQRRLHTPCKTVSSSQVAWKELGNRSLLHVNLPQNSRLATAHKLQLLTSMDITGLTQPGHPVRTQRMAAHPTLCDSSLWM